jgi:hypothetical protein
MPPKLAATCIKAGTSQKGCCPKCGAQWVRVVDRYRTHNGVRKDDIGAWRNTDPGAPVGAQGDGHWRYASVCETKGWKPGCNCGLEPCPARVFDPFGGAMTTVVAAEALGRIGIATELSAKYVAIGKRRLERPHLRAPSGRRADLPGQMTLFGDP